MIDLNEPDIPLAAFNRTVCVDDGLPKCPIKAGTDFSVTLSGQMPTALSDPC